MAGRKDCHVVLVQHIFYFEYRVASFQPECFCFFGQGEDDAASSFIAVRNDDRLATQVGAKRNFARGEESVAVNMNDVHDG